ncbi:uncharacterized protein LOC106162466 [Lingula anatina]|uniref:Uncharacterized protein LOC106162466 n=1 Tax=Lingula anatina TaxID=7574 RepID=A0A1S3IAD8_LINAN|nr:uncharacterized protein LOC106162466 [Lingula anatina]|eukprot:XP_013395230.1 uncharacterized protein LOC106162466 [Lingula anatina]
MYSLKGKTGPGHTRQLNKLTGGPSSQPGINRTLWKYILSLAYLFLDHVAVDLIPKPAVITVGEPVGISTSPVPHRTKMERLGRQNILPAAIFNILLEVDQVPSMYSVSKVGEELFITLKWKTDPRTPKMMSSEVNTLSAMKVVKKKTPSRIRRDKQRKQKWLEEREMRRAVPLSEETVDTSKLPVTEENSFSKINIRTDLPFQECENLADVIDLSATSKTELQLLQAKCHKLTKEI